MSKQNTPTGLFSPSRFSFGKLLTPKTKQVIDFDSQPPQSGTPTVKKSGLEAYAKKNKLTLPPDFSDKVLECEMELERDQVSIDAITKLTDLYAQAMSFYEAEGNHKYKYFAKKLQDLMLKPTVKETMVREIAPVKTVEDDKELRRMRLESQVSQVNTEKEAFALVKSHENKEKEIKKVLEKDLTSQRDRIQKKLAERKAKSQSRAQSVTYISDENSSTTEEAQAEQDVDSSPKAHKLIKIEEADEADENRYGTPPRRRSKDGQMIFYFPKGKKNLKKLFLEELKKGSEEVKKVKGHARRYSENKPPVLAPVNNTVAAKRVGRAQSFSARTAFPTLVDKARKISSNSLEKDEETKTESHEKDPKSLSGIGKEDALENHSNAEKKEEEKAKSNNTVEETDEEGSKGDGSSSKNSVGQEEETAKENSQEGVEKNEEVKNQEEKVDMESEIVEEKTVVVGSVILNNEVAQEEVGESKEEEAQVEREIEEAVVETVEKQEEKLEREVEAVVEAVVEEVEKLEEKEVEKEAIVEAVVEETEKLEEKQEEEVEKVVEAVVEEVEKQEEEKQIENEVERQEEKQIDNEPVEVAEAKEEEVVEKAEVVEEVREEVIQENKESEVVAEQMGEKESEEQAVQENNEVLAAVDAQEEVEITKEEKVEEIQQEEAVDDAQALENIVAEMAQEEQEEQEQEEEVKPVEVAEDVQAVDTTPVETVKEEEQENRQVESVNVETEAVTSEETVQVQTQEENNENGNDVSEVQEQEEKQSEVVNQEEVKIEAENIPQTQEAVAESSENSPNARRRRTDSEIADEEKLKMMRKIDEENKVLLEELISKQEKLREEAGKQVEEKFAKKLQAMEEDMEPDEKLSMMWQKAVAKINKDKETELQKVLEGLVQEHSQEAEKYKKKLQQQKMFKLAQLSS